MIKQNLEELLEEKVILVIEGIDRLYLNAYQPMLQTDSGISHLFRNHRGVVAITCTTNGGMAHNGQISPLLAW